MSVFETFEIFKSYTSSPVFLCAYEFYSVSLRTKPAVIGTFEQNIEILSEASRFRDFLKTVYTQRTIQLFLLTIAAL